MQIIPTITFRGIRRSPTIEAAIQERLGKLERYYRGIIGCRVLVELAQRHHESGNRYHVKIDLSVPGDSLVVTHQASLYGAAKDLGASKLQRTAELDRERKRGVVAVHEAFDIAKRQLQENARRHRREVKQSVGSSQGRISQLFPVEGYGYIEASDGREVYFQKSSVLISTFESLTVGRVVSYTETPGDKGPRASTVRCARRRSARRSDQSPLSSAAC